VNRTRPPSARTAIKRALAALALGTSLNGPALSADIPLKAPRLQPAFDWSGLYFGAHAGFGRGFSNATLTDPAVAATGNFFGGPFGGLQAGYNFQLPSRIVLGLEADVTFPNYIHGNSVISMLATAKSWVIDDMDFAGSLPDKGSYRMFVDFNRGDKSYVAPFTVQVSR